MRKSLFAGITVLEPDESILQDDGAFIGRDRDTIDRFLEIGAKTHRHTGLPGIDNPELELPVVEAIPSGGTIPAGISFTLGYSLVDGDGGETMLSPTSTVTTAAPLEQPLAAPIGEVDYDDGGNLLVETFYYVLTYIDAEGGETPPGAWLSIEREPGFPNARVLLSGLTEGMANASASGWRLYRAVGGGTFDYMATGASAGFIDDGSVSPNCDIHPPPDEVNTTNNINQLRIVLPGSATVGSASGIRLYGTNTGAFLGDVLLGAYPASSAGQTDFFTSYDPQPGAPPDRNHSIGGASKIDPDVELLDWHWKRPVAASGSLPAGELGDVRVVTDEDAAYAYTSSGWVAVWRATEGRYWASAITGSLASGASGEVDLTLATPLNRALRGGRIIEISTSKRSRARVYGRSSDRTADRGRDLGTQPTIPHGVLLDYPATTFPSGMIAPVAPPADAHNLDDPAQTKLYLNITNYDAAGSVVVGLLISPTEYT